MILTTPEECQAWLTAPWEQAKALQRPLPDVALQVVARGVKKDGELGAMDYAKKARKTGYRGSLYIKNPNI